MIIVVLIQANSIWILESAIVYKVCKNIRNTSIKIFAQGTKQISIKIHVPASKHKYPPISIPFRKKGKKNSQKTKKETRRTCVFPSVRSGVFFGTVGPVEPFVRDQGRLSHFRLHPPRDWKLLSLCVFSGEHGPGKWHGGKKTIDGDSRERRRVKMKERKKKEKSGSEKEAKGSWYKRDRIRREIKNRMRETSSAKFIFSALSVFLLIVSRFRVSSFFFFLQLSKKLSIFFFFFCVMYFICDILCSIVYFLTNCKLVFISFSFLFSLTSFFSTFFL